MSNKGHWLRAELEICLEANAFTTHRLFRLPRMTNDLCIGFVFAFKNRVDDANAIHIVW